MATSGPDIERLRLDFCSMILRAKGATVAHFVAWLDLKVAEYKVYGHMILTNEDSDSQPNWQDSSGDPTSWPVGEQPDYGDQGSEYDDQDPLGAQSTYTPPKKKSRSDSAQSDALDPGNITFPDSQTPAIAGDMTDINASSGPSGDEHSLVADIKPKLEPNPDLGFPIQTFSASSPVMPAMPPAMTSGSVRPFMSSPRGRGSSMRARGATMRGGMRVSMRGRGGIRMPSTKPAVQMPRPMPEPGGSEGNRCVSGQTKRSYNQCSICNKEFASEKELVWHMQSCAISASSETEMRFVCPVCRKGFKSKVILKQHQMTHIDLRFSPYKCAKCDRPFNRKSNCLRHELLCKKHTHGGSLMLDESNPDTNLLDYLGGMDNY